MLLAALPYEDSDIAVGRWWPGRRRRLLGGYLPYEPYRGQLAEVLAERLADDAGRQQPAARRGPRPGPVDADADLLRGWLDGTDVPDGLAVDADLRWLITLQLARLGAIGDAEIDAELARDKSSEGIVHATECRAALPTPAAKERAWALIDRRRGRELRAVRRLRGFWHPTQTELTAPYVDRYFAEIAGTEKFRSGWVVANSTRASFPRFSIDERVVRLSTGTGRRRGRRGRDTSGRRRQRRRRRPGAGGPGRLPRELIGFGDLAVAVTPGCD